MRKFSILIYFILLLFLPIYGDAQQTPSIQVYVFYIEECPSCGGILQGYLPYLKSTYPFLDIKTFNVENPSYYEALVKLEKQYGRKGNEFPVVFIGDQLLSGEREVMERLNPLILEYQFRGTSLLPPLEVSSQAKPSQKTFTEDILYFYQKGCPKCDRVSYLLKYIGKKYPRLNVKEIDLNTLDGKRLNEAFSNRLRLPAEKRLIAPSVFIGNSFLPSDEITEMKVEALIQKYERIEGREGMKESEGLISKPISSPTPEEIKKAEESIVERFKSLGVLAILSAGLIEGLNPCAFATLIFFISYLTMIGRKRNEILWVGLGFSGSNFFTHLLLGFGIFGFVQHLSFLPLFSRVVYLITLAIALFLGIFSLYDYIQLKRGKPGEMKLQLPQFLKKRVHQTIRKVTSSKIGTEESKSFRFFLAAVGIGFIVSLLQFTCTSQVYLPTILFVTNIPSLRGNAILYLILYNLIYILPLVVIFGIVYWGVTSEQLAFFLQKRASTIKLLTSIFFFILAGILITLLFFSV